MILRYALPLATLSVALSPASAEQWSQFRGSRSDGVLESGSLPTSWASDRNVAWKIALPGEGWSSPIVWDGKLFVTMAIEDAAARAARLAKEKARTADGDSDTDGGRRGGRRGRGGGDDTPPDTVFTWEVHCLDAATGTVLWKQVAHKSRPRVPKHTENTYATETPITDGQRVVAYFGMVGVFCYDLTGKELWKRDLGAFPMQAGFGTASSPVLHDGMVFLQVDNEEQSFIVALDVVTGSERWRTPRTEKSSWGSPIVWKTAQRAELIAGGAVTRSYDPKTGQPLWELDMGGGRSSASPVASGDVLIVGTEERNRGNVGGGTLFAVKAGASGNITPAAGATTSAGVLWSQPKAASPAASPVVCRGQVFVLGRRGGMVNCYDLRTGDPVYQKQRIPDAGAFWASPWAVEDRVYCLDDVGVTHVLQAGGPFKHLASNTLPDHFWSTPALGKGAIYLRGIEHLFCVKGQP